MKIRILASSIVCCIVLSGSDVDALQVPGASMGVIEGVQGKDERVLLKDCVVRKGTSQMAREIKKVHKNSKIEVLKEEGDWAKVSLNGEIGYIELENIKRVGIQAKVMYLEGVEYLDVYSDMSGQDSKKIGKITNNEKVLVMEELGQYIRIRWDGSEGYVKNVKNCLVNKIKRVTKESTVIYSKVKGNTMHKRIGKGEVVEVEEILSEYYKVSYKGSLGYMKKDALEDIKYVGMENLKAIKMYVDSEDNSEIRTYIPSGSDVEVICYEEDYAYVKYGEYKGYIRFDNLSKEEIDLIEISGNETIVSKKILDRSEIEKRYYEVVKGLDEENYEKVFSDFKTKWGLKVVGENTNIKVKKNRGRYLEVLIDGEEYYIDNKGIASAGDMSKLTYIQSSPVITTKGNTRYINKMDASVYLDSDKEVLLGLLVEDAQVELIESLKGNTSRVRINGSEVYVDSSVLSKYKMYRVVKEDITKLNTGKSHKAYVKSQSGKLNIVMSSSGVSDSSLDEIAYYSNPKKISIAKDEYKYQYLKLDEFRMINANKLNEYLNSIPVTPGKKNIFKDKADEFISAARKYNIDPVYLVAHTLLETGKGKSNLAQGQDYKGKAVVYNFFGIGAVDSNPLEGGKVTAYKNGWTSIDKTIEGSARWLSDNYIHSDKNKQNTLYKMRYNYSSRSHQYATDVQWAIKISRYMNELSYLYEDTVLRFEVPLYKQGSYMSGSKKPVSVDKEDKPPVTEKPDEGDKEEEKPPVTEKPDEGDKEEEKPPVTEKPDEGDKEEEKPPVTEKPDEGDKEEEKPPVTEKPDEGDKSQKMHKK